MGRGPKPSRSRRGGNPPSIKIDKVTSLVSERERKEREVDEVLTAFRNVNDEYGYIINDIQVATLKGKSSAMAYYDGANIAIVDSYFDSDAITQAYDMSVASGFHPGRGNKTALEATAAHELGHALTDVAARKMGLGYGGLDEAANRIVKEAAKETGHRGVVIMAEKISGYATYSNAEAVAEAFADVYSNGAKAKKESSAIVRILNRYAK